jgi:hypothetical protein
MKFYLTVFILLIFAVLIPSSAEAHSPYAVKQGIIYSLDNKPLIIEKLYGDGIFVADPQKFQIRNMNGAVIASSETATHIFFACPSINFCWVFPHGSGSLFAYGYKLDPNVLDFDKTLSEKETSKANTEQANLLTQYLTDKSTKNLRHPILSDPEFPDGPPVGFKKSSASVIVSPIAIILNHIAAYLIAFFIPFIVLKLIRKYLSYSKNGNFRVLKKIFGFILLIGVIQIYFVVFFTMSFTLSIPAIYLLAFFIWANYIAMKKK